MADSDSTTETPSKFKAFLSKIGEKAIEIGAKPTTVKVAAIAALGGLVIGAILL